MEKIFNIFASYSQVSVFHAALENPFNEWTPELIAQGFSWRVGSVAFKLPEESGDLVVKVAISDEFRQNDASLRIIRVPFIVPEGGNLEIASITDSREIAVPEGQYSLYFELIKSVESKMSCLFTFCRNFQSIPEIVKADTDIERTSSLIMDSKPA